MHLTSSSVALQWHEKHIQKAQGVKSLALNYGQAVFSTNVSDLEKYNVSPVGLNLFICHKNIQQMD